MTLRKQQSLLEADEKVAREKLPKEDFYDKLKENKFAFQKATTKEISPKISSKGASNTTQLLKQVKYLMQSPQYTEEQKAYLKRVTDRLEEGALPEQTIKESKKILQESFKMINAEPLKIFTLLKKCIPNELLESHASEKNEQKDAPQEIILSEYLIGK